MSIREMILTVVEDVARQQGKMLAPLDDELALVNSGLDSLCIAIIVVNLEDSLGVDPFDQTDGAMMPVTLGAFIRLYENAKK